MIINIRGTSGAGKSWVVRQLMKRFSAELVYLPNVKRPVGHQVLPSTRIAGPYINANGGCDDLTNHYMSYDALGELIRSWDAEGQNVVFEGLIISGIFGRYLDLARSVKDYRWVFLDMPLEVCRQRMAERRLAKAAATGKPPPALVAADKIAGKFEEVTRVYYKCKAIDLPVWKVSGEEAVELIAGWLA